MSRQGAPARAAPLQDTQASLSALQSEYSQSFSNEQPPAGDRDCWSQCLDRVKTHDEDMIKKYQEDMDALLVFAGVFSAVLTPFNIEAYKMLGPTPAEKGNELLQGILQQMSNFTVNNNYINTTSPYMPLSDQFRPPLSAIVINCTWFASLVCSLAAASLAILIKQWLHAYIDWPGKSPRASLHLRQLRFEGLQKWGCHQFINSLSILLEAALVLFFIGLWVFVRTLHPTVTVLITTLLLSYGSVLVSTTILPAIYTGCPYKSPLAFVLYTGLQHVLNHTIVYWKFFLRRTRIGLYIFFDFKVPLSDEHFHEESISPDDWAKRERASIRVTVQREKEISLLAWADKQFADDRFLRTVIIPCLLHMPKTSAELCASSILKDRLPSLKSPLGTRPHTKRNPSFALLQSLWNERISNERNTDTQNLAKSLVGRVTRLSASEANVLRRYLNQICSVLLDSKTSDVERRQAFSNLANLLIPAPTTVFSELIKRKCYRLASELRRREAPQDVPAFDLLDPAKQHALVNYAGSLLPREGSEDEKTSPLVREACILIHLLGANSDAVPDDLRERRAEWQEKLKKLDHDPFWTVLSISGSVRKVPVSESPTTLWSGFKLRYEDAKKLYDIMESMELGLGYLGFVQMWSRLRRFIE